MSREPDAGPERNHHHQERSDEHCGLSRQRRVLRRARRGRFRQRRRHREDRRGQGSPRQLPCVRRFRAPVQPGAVAGARRLGALGRCRRADQPGAGGGDPEGGARGDVRRLRDAALVVILRPRDAPFRLVSRLRAAAVEARPRALDRRSRASAPGLRRAGYATVGAAHPLSGPQDRRCAVAHGSLFDREPRRCCSPKAGASGS